MTLGRKGSYSIIQQYHTNKFTQEAKHLGDIECPLHSIFGVGVLSPRALSIDDPESSVKY